MFQEGSVDYIISVCSEEIPDVVRTEIARERVLLALPEHHPAIAHAYQVGNEPYPHLDLRYLDRETFIIPMAGQSMRMTVNRIFQQARIRPGRLIEIGHFDVIMSMVNVGLGIGFNRLGYIHDMQKFEHVRYFFVDHDAYRSSLELIRRKGHVISDCERDFLDILVKTIQSRYGMEAVGKYKDTTDTENGQ